MGVQNPATPVRTALEGPKFEELRQVCNRIDPDYNPDPLVRPAIRESLEHSGIISIAQMYRMTPKEIAALYRIGSDKACHLVDVIFICLEVYENVAASGDNIEKVKKKIRSLMME
jgi:hypothetical protein